MTMARLIEAVGRGGQLTAFDFRDGFGKGAKASACNDACFAYNGSLDAAKRLHDALLPGWEWLVRSRGDYACVWEPEEMGDKDAEAVSAGNPARAFLLAILRAMEGR